MPWEVSDPVSLRNKFVVRLLEGEKMVDLCSEFGISRKTGYKIYNRFLERGKEGLADQSRRPRRLGNLLDGDISRVLLRLKRDKPTWGAPKIRELLMRKHPGIHAPAISTIHALFSRESLVESRRKRGGFKSTGTYLSKPVRPNDLWCTDFKGQFRLGDKSLCYPLTITDQVSRHIHTIEALEKISEVESIEAFKMAFQEYGLPVAIRSDNGVPFASRGIFGLSKLSVFWLRLGIKLERIQPGNPQQNGQHERMHRTLKFSAEISQNLLLQQEKFDLFREEFNQERPHAALAMKTPAEIYQKSPRAYPGIAPGIVYDDVDFVAKVTSCGSFYPPKTKQKIFLGVPLGEQPIGVTQVESGLWQVRFMEHDLGFYDAETMKFSPGQNPFCLP